jgi:hypothetical protein
MKRFIPLFVVLLASFAGDTNLVVNTPTGTMQGLAYTMPVCLFLGPLQDNVRVEMSVSTNIVVEWVSLRPTLKDEDLAVHIEDGSSAARTTYLPTYAGVSFGTLELRYEYLKQVGTVVTNRVLRVAHGGKVQEVILAELGRDAWPTKQRTLTLRAN